MTYAAPQSAVPQRLTDTEKWVADQVSTQGDADLTEKYKDPRKRVLRASFLRELVLGTRSGHKLPAKGATITGGIVREELDLTNERVADDIAFVNFHFLANVTCVGTKFDGAISFEKSTIEGDLSLNGAKVGDDCLLNDATFKKGVDLTEIDIHGQLVADHAKFISPTDDCNFNSMTVRDLVSFDTATFEGPVDFSAAVISNDLEADNAQFNSKEKGASFDGIKIADTVMLNKAIFEGPVSFSYADIKGQLLLDGADFRNKKHEARFNSAKVGNILSVDGATFEGPVYFTAVNAGQIYATKTHFDNTGEGVDLSNSVVERDARFQHATFQGPANFTSASIGNDLNISDGQFTSTKDTPDFNSIKVANRVFLHGASFDGGVSFIAGRVGDSFEAQEAHFNSPERTANFNTLKVGRSIFFTDATFDGPVDFVLAEVESTFSAAGAQFRSSDKEVSFNTMRVKETCSVQRAFFYGSVDFTAAEIGMSFQADGAHFISNAKDVYFGMNCARTGFFRGVIFAGSVFFTNATFTDLAIDLSETSSSIPKLDMSRASVHRQLQLEHAKIDEFRATFLRVEGSAQIRGIVVDEMADLAYADFVTLDITGSTWPQRAECFHIQGMNYKTIRASGNDHESHKMLMDLAGHAAFTSEVYGSLEQFFSRQGYNADADEVFIEGKARERKEYLQGFHWLGSYLLAVLTGYGRHPIYVSGLCVVFVALGCVLFSKGNMQLQARPEKGDPPRVYNAFWYSLGLFLPFVDLQVDKLWKPKRSRSFLRNYVRIHILLGWILIPVLVAALTGLIK